MSETYHASLLVIMGVCIGFALHAANLAMQTRERRYGHLFALAVLEGAYCLVTWRYLGETDSAAALPWGQVICVFTPYITWVFGELTLDLTGSRPRGFALGQKINLALTTAFAVAVGADLVFETGIVLDSVLFTDLESAHRHRLSFRPLGMAYLSWVSIAFCIFAALLFRHPHARRELAPMTLGCVAYFAATVLDFAILIGLRGGHFIQHLGFFALLFGCWRVLAARFEQSLAENKAAVERLEQQRQKLLMTAPRLHQQKLDSLGTLAAGVAHEINNPVAGILNYAQIMKRLVASESEERKFLDEIEREGTRVASIVRNLLRFGRAEESHNVVADAREIVSDTLTLVRSLLAEDGIAVRVEVGEDVPQIVCRVQQIQQVLMNLVLNARDALNRRSPERAEPKEVAIHVRTQKVDGTDWVIVDVVDNGDGLDPKVVDRIFDPFFTTKPNGEGVGLGLSISHGIVIAHGGTLSCESETGKLTRFRVRIPCAPPECARS